VKKLVVALDAPDLQEGRRLAAVLAGKVGAFKVGLELFTRCGPAAVEAASACGAAVFLDLKVHDIPRTAAAAVKSAAALSARFLTLHALGGPAMIAAAREAAEAFGEARPKLLAVTVLTSHGPDEMARIGLAGTPEANVLRLARLAVDAGADGVVASPREASSLRRELGATSLIVTPGIRPSGSAAGDQVRTATPAEAIRAGADLLVVGRPIVAAPDPAAAAEAILAEIAAALSGG
jgi:orotidine-5'-phosphate decarboxylase